MADSRGAKINDTKIVVALDYTNAKDALLLVNQLDPAQCKLKVGKELYTATGPALVEKLIAKDFKVFLDLKFHDIPNTVKKACKAASDLGIWMLNVHASGGSAMMEAALEGVNQSNKNPYLIAVTVLTSMNQATLSEIGNKTPIQEQVLRLATLTQTAGLHGVVCSAQEATLLRQHVNPEFLLVTPGIRPTNASKDDQSRIVTPPDALRQGASYLVIGRPITQAAQPQQALQAILQSIQ
ncbi:MAG: orotidine-5'-phosphate decarboxylase [Methylophilaceae bacterium]